MDWLRRVFGYHDSREGAGNPFRGPSWEEIMERRDSRNMQDSHDKRHPSEEFFQRGFPSDDVFPPNHDLFGHINDMFSQLDGMMRDMHRHPAWTLPDAVEEPDPKTPRDSMLKEPNSDPTETVPLPPVPSHPHKGYESETYGFHGGQDDLRQYTDSFMMDPHGLFERIFQGFGLHPPETPFPDQVPQFGSEPDSEDHSRDSLMKKQDSDIDDRVSGDISNLPEGGPGYAHDGSQTLQPKWSPWQHSEGPATPHSGVHQKFYSQSVVTIRRPDGSIEETKKYRDSTGREEVTVTHTQPEGETHGEATLQPRAPMDHGIPSIFSWIFTR